MNFFQRWLDKKLQLPMSYEIKSIRKDPQCKRPECGPGGIRTDLRMGKHLGKGPVYCNCCIVESNVKDDINRTREFFGLSKLK